MILQKNKLPPEHFMQIQENLKKKQQKNKTKKKQVILWECPTNLTVCQSLFYGLHVCYDQRDHWTAVIENIRGMGKYIQYLQKSVCFSKMLTQKNIFFFCIPTRFSSILNTQYLELCNFSSKWIQWKNLSILIQFLHFEMNQSKYNTSMEIYTSVEVSLSPFQFLILIAYWSTVIWLVSTHF